MSCPPGPAWPAAAHWSSTENSAPTITSAASANSIVGAAFSHRDHHRRARTRHHRDRAHCPPGLTFVDNGNGTATIVRHAHGRNRWELPDHHFGDQRLGDDTQAFTLTNSGAPTITSPATATFYNGSNGTYTVTTTGYPAATITETGTLPAGLTFVARARPRVRPPSAAPPRPRWAPGPPVSISATNSSGSTATLAWSSRWPPPDHRPSPALPQRTSTWVRPERWPWPPPAVPRPP